MNKLLLVVCFLLVSISGYSATITVDDDGPADCNNIQTAIDAAANGDVIIVADVVYTCTGNHNISFDEKTLTLKSENGPTNCTIDCQNVTDCTAFTIEDCDPVIECFTIVRCSGLDADPETWPLDTAIWINNSNGTIKNCIFTDNSSCIYCWGVATYGEMTASVVNCTFYGNTAGEYSGAVGMSTS